MNRRSVAALGLGAAFLAGMGLYVATRIQVSTGLSHFLSAAPDLELASVSTRIADSMLTRTMILSLEGPSVSTAIDAAGQWAKLLEKHPEVAALRSGPGQDLVPAIFELYFPRRHLFLSDEPEVDLAERLSDRGLRSAARALKEELALPESQLVKEVAGRDPLLAFASVLRRIEAARLGALRVVDGHFVGGDPPTAILFLTTRHSPFDASYQAPFEDFLERSFAELDHRFDGSLSLERSSVHRFAAVSERHARSDMVRISAISLAAIGALFLALFRSLRLIAISLLPLAGGILTATSAVLFLFGKVHVITLAFGSTLIGVCIDYPIHYVNHHTASAVRRGPWLSMREIWPALVMGALTTVAGFVGLAWSDFPGVREIGVFAAVGVLAALVTTRVLLPPLMPRSNRSTDLQERLAAAMGRLLGWMYRHTGALAAIPLIAVVVCAVGLPQVTWQDDVFALNVPLAPEWIDEDRRVRERTSQMDAGRFVVVIGRDEESALRLNDEVHRRLQAGLEADLLEQYRSLHAFLWSEDLQNRNLATVGAAPDLALRAISALEAEGFRPQAFSGFTETLQGDPPEALHSSDLLRSPLADLVAPFRVELEAGVALLTFLRGVRDPEALADSLSDLEGVHYFDQKRFLADMYGKYRRKSTALILGGSIAVIALLTLRYRKLRDSLAAAAPAFLAAASTLSLLAIAGVPVDILHLLGLLLVLSFGVDYSIFLLESRNEPTAIATTMLSITIACASTCLAFGLLAASSFPALRALGTTTGLGVVLSLILAPTALVFARPTLVVAPGKW